jgi:oxalate---CoA ligase
VLRIDAVGVDDDFFALGGDSLQATEMIVNVSDLLDADIDLADFVDRPTIGGLIGIHDRAATAAGGPRVRGTTVAIQTAGSAPAMYCPATHDNGLWGVSRLVRHLGKERPVYGLRVPPLDARGPVSTVEDIAARNVAAILRLSPEGPSHLLGTCSGGVVAFEMARQLERLGHPVGLVVMIDSFNRAWRQTQAATAPTRMRSRHMLDRLRYHWEHLRGLGMRDRIVHVRIRAGFFVAHYRAAAGHLAFGIAARAGLPRPAFLRTFAYANGWAQRRYQPGPYAGDVLLVRSTVPIAGVYPLPRMGWSALMPGNVTMLELPCEQAGLWTDDRLLHQVSQEIAQALRAADARRAGC